MRKNWREFALCAKDSKSERWHSYDIDDIEYAKSICKKCKVKMECITTALQAPEYYGVNAGISEFEFKLLTWKKASTIYETNWSRSRKTLQKVLRKIQ
jgi:hypothetical protein